MFDLYAELSQYDSKKYNNKKFTYDKQIHTTLYQYIVRRKFLNSKACVPRPPSPVLRTMVPPPVKMGKFKFRLGKHVRHSNNTNTYHRSDRTFYHVYIQKNLYNQWFIFKFNPDIQWQNYSIRLGLIYGSISRIVLNIQCHYFHKKAVSQGTVQYNISTFPLPLHHILASLVLLDPCHSVMADFPEP